MAIDGTLDALGIHLGGILPRVVGAIPIDPQNPVRPQLSALFEPARFEVLPHGVVPHARLRRRGQSVRRVPIPITASGQDIVAALAGPRTDSQDDKLPVLISQAWNHFCFPTAFESPDFSDLVNRDRAASDALIGVAIRDYVSSDSKGSAPGPNSLVLCIPDSLSEDCQETLLGFLCRDQREGRLIWRPVAAALELLATSAIEGIEAMRPGHSAGTFLSVHCGSDGFEATLLELIRSKSTPARLLPARRRPDPGSPNLRGAAIGLALLRDALARLHDSSFDSSRGRGGVPQNTPDGMFFTPTTALLQLLRIQSPEELHPALLIEPERIQGAAVKLEQDLLAALERHPSGRGDLEDLRVTTTLHLTRRQLSRSPGVEFLAKWIADSRRALEEAAKKLAMEGRPANLRGVLVSGDFAELPVGGVAFGQRLVGALLSELSISRSMSALPVLIEGTSLCPAGALARGAARYGVLCRADSEAYLDSLPAMETLLVSRGHPQWISLLGEQSDQFVEGNREWVREPHYGPLYIKPNAKQLDLLLWLGSEDRVKKVQIPVPPASHRRQVMLEVRIKPAGGNARVKAVPEQVESFGRVNLLLDWKRAEVEKKSKQELVAEAEVPCPATIKRAASLELWRYVEAWIGQERPLDRLSQTFARSQALDRLCDHLCRLLKKLIPEGGAGKSGIAVTAATDQDGNPPSTAGDSGQQFQLLMRELAKYCAALPVHSLPSSALAVLGLAALKNSDTDKIIKALIQREVYDREVCTLIGGCLREEKSFNQLARVLHQRLEMTGLDNNNYLMGSFAEIIQFQEDITNGITSDGAAKLVSQLIRSLETAFRGGRLKFLERNAIAIVAFLMRRRIFDEDFFAPDSQLAMQAKRVLELGLQGVERGFIRPIGGRINAPVLMQRVIDYIDKRGSIEPLVYD